MAKNWDEAKRIAGRYMLTNEEDVLDSTVDWFIKRVGKRPYPTLKGIQYPLDQVAPRITQAKSAKPERFIDLSWLEQLNNESFFVEMVKRDQRFRRSTQSKEEV